MSASSIDAFTCMRARSFAITNSTGAWNDAATVCPMSTLRASTTPSTGAEITVCPRSTCAWLSAASDCFTAALFAWCWATADW